MNKALFIIFVLSLSTVSAATTYSFKRIHPIRKYEYGVDLISDKRGNYKAVIWRGNKNNKMEKKIYKAKFDLIHREFKRFKYLAKFKNEKIPKRANKLNKYEKAKGLTEFATKGPLGEMQINYNRYSIPKSYMESRVEEWFNYLDQQIIRTNSLKFKKL